MAYLKFSSSCTKYSLSLLFKDRKVLEKKLETRKPKKKKK